LSISNLTERRSPQSNKNRIAGLHDDEHREAARPIFAENLAAAHSACLRPFQCIALASVDAFTGEHEMITKNTSRSLKP